MNIDFTKAIEQIETMLTNAIAAIPNMIVAIIIFAIFYVVAIMIRNLIRRVVSRNAHRVGLGILLGRLARWTIVLVGMMVGFVIVFPDFSPAQLLELLGLGSIAVGFALRDILQNFVSGILLLLTEPFHIGDQIEVDDFEGTVETIAMRETTITTYDNRCVVIPNTQLVTSPVTVNTAYEKRRVQYDIGIGYGSDIELAKDTIRKALRGMPGIMDDPAPQVIVVELGDFSITLRVRWWIQPAVRREAVITRDEVLPRILAALEAQEVDMPFPTQTVRVRQMQ